MGIHNYYSMASCVSSDFRVLAYGIKTSIKIRLQDRIKKADGRILPKYAAKHYGKSKEIRFVGNAVLLPIAYVQHRPPIHKEKKINKYTKEGRTVIHKTLEKVDINMVHAVMRNPIKGESVEYNDNRISLYVAQGGKCAVLNRKLSIEDIHCHHIIPRSKGGKDNYTNLMILDKEIHKLIHATNKETILICLRKEKLNNSELQKVNKLRILAGNEVIEEQYLSMCFEQ